MDKHPSNKPQLHTEESDVAIVGAGPSGASTAASLARTGLHIQVIEGRLFPRFSIGDKLPQSMVHLEICGQQEVAQAGGYQLKNATANHAW